MWGIFARWGLWPPVRWGNCSPEKRMNLPSSQNQWNRSVLFWGVRTLRPATLLLSAASCWCEAGGASLYLGWRNQPLGQRHWVTWQASLLLPPSHPGRSSGCLIVPIYKRWTESKATVDPDRLHDLRGLLSPARCLTCPLSFRCSPGRWPETHRSLVSPSCVSSHRSITPLACFLLVNRIRTFMAFLRHCATEITFRVRHSECVLVPRFPFCFCWQLQQWLQYWLLSFPVLWPRLWGPFPSSDITVSWTRRMSNCLPLQLNFSYTGAWGEAAQPPLPYSRSGRCTRHVRWANKVSTANHGYKSRVFISSLCISKLQ